MRILSNQTHDLKNLAGRIDNIHDRKTITDAVWAIEQLSEKAREVRAHWEYNPNGMGWNRGAWRCSNCKEINKNIVGDEYLHTSNGGVTVMYNADGSILTEADK